MNSNVDLLDSSISSKSAKKERVGKD